MMNRSSCLFTLTGFLMGAGLGILMELAFVRLWNLACGWLKCALCTLTWWEAIPLPLLVGFSMAYWVTHYPLAD